MLIRSRKIISIVGFQSQGRIKPWGDKESPHGIDKLSFPENIKRHLEPSQYKLKDVIKTIAPKALTWSRIKRIGKTPTWDIRQI